MIFPGVLSCGASLTVAVVEVSRFRAKTLNELSKIAYDFVEISNGLVGFEPLLIATPLPS